MIGDGSTTVIELWRYNHLRKSTKPVYKNQSISPVWLNPIQSNQSKT